MSRAGMRMFVGVLAAALALLSPTHPAAAMSGADRAALRSAADAGKVEEALALAEKTAAREDGDPEGAGWKAALLFRLDRREEAQAILRSFSSLHKDSEPKLLDRFCTEALDLAVGSPDPKVRQAAFESIEQTAEKTHSGAWNAALHRAVLADPKPELRQVAAHALRRVGGKEARDLFRKDVQSDDAELRRIAADALVRLGDDSAAPALKKELSSPDPERRRWAARELVKIDDEDAIPAIAGDLGSGDRSVRLATIQLLEELGSKAAVPVFRKALEDPDVDVRRAAARALAAKGDSSGLEIIREELRSANASGKLKAMTAVEGLGAKEALPDLEAALKDPDEKVQQAAAELLDKFGNPEGKTWKETHESALEKAAGAALLPIAIASKAPIQKPPSEKIVADSRYVRAAGAREAGQLGAEEGRPVVLKGMDDKDALVRRSAVWSAAESGDKTLLPSLVDKTADSDPGVRLGACGAILVLLEE